MTDSILVIDVGSSSVRALLLDESGAVIPGALARRLHRFDADATVDALALRRLAEACIDEVLLHPAATTITAVGMACFVGNLMGIDSANEPLTPLYSYADSRSHPDARLLMTQQDPIAVHARTGCRIHPAYHPAKLHWLRRTQPGLFAQVRRWTDFATWCYGCWFGAEIPCSYSVASWSGLLQRQTLSWDHEWLGVLGVKEDHLPALADFNAVQQGLSAPFATRWPSLREVPFYLAVGDGAAANMGSGGTRADLPVLTVGTSAALRIVTETPGPVAAGLWAYRVDAGRHLIGGATNEGGNIFAWAKQTLQLNPTELEATLLQREPGAHGLVVLPLLAGERSPGYLAEALGTIHGLKLSTTPLDILHGLLEGVGFRLRLIYDQMQRPGEFVLAGGGALAQSLAWAQILADTLATPLHVCEIPEATARGVALLIRQSEADPITDLPMALRIVHPRGETRKRVEALLWQHAELYERLWATV